MHKFKLKKDGKVVGYMKIEKRKKMRRYYSRPDDLIVRYKGCLNHSTWHSQPVIVSSFDTAEPFVCLDKNKEEVYAGDKTNNGIVEYSEEKLRWIIEGVPIRHYKNIKLLKD